MVVQAGIEGADFLELRFFVGLAMQARGNVGRRAQQQRCGQHRAEGRRQQQAAKAGGQQVVLLHLRHQGKTELTALCQCQTAAPSRFTVAAAVLDQ
ncbi:hypothetical protein D3C84_1147830 [compost metagenome]